MPATAGNRKNGVRSAGYLVPAIEPVACATYYVHLCSGEIIEVAPVTDVRVTEVSVIVLNGPDVVATYPRPSVYFISDRPMEPPSLN